MGVCSSNGEPPPECDSAQQSDAAAPPTIKLSIKGPRDSWMEQVPLAVTASSLKVKLAPQCGVPQLYAKYLQLWFSRMGGELWLDAKRLDQYPEQLRPVPAPAPVCSIV